MMVWNKLQVKDGAEIQKICGFLSSRHCKDLLDRCKNIALRPLKHEGEIHRHEGVIESGNFPGFESWLQEINIQINDYYSKKLRPECFLFKYVAGQYVPWHIDKSRHHIVIMIYLGVFRGGDYVFKSKGLRNVVGLKEGDLLMAINKRPNGKSNNIEHMVMPIETGTRYVIAISYVPWYTCSKR